MIYPGLKKPSARRRLLFLLPLVLLLSMSSRHLPDEVTLHISPLRHGVPLPDGFYIYQRLNEKGIAIKSITPENDSIIVRLSLPEQTSAAREILSTALPYTIVIAQQTHGVTPCVKS
ncbi:EnvZ/OmpR regulon moderator MzrA [Dickeya sp. CFBP 2040]|uniref:EnvZ/OmpR regulon moderator MzrA n=1 Tax=Dickeya sp. CFBP 2040 TaxID=2718531 RepID=UPI001445A8A9|nr:EnvZ/OmpR regulon moderator MzrA [Dickeya sp. CFBP 2040]NKI72975.1 EnvZ/OmpR regulon moderator MzrA [Dickeya sp. CFBP 2040]